MKIIGIIPSRFASTRLPGKALAEIAGKPMVQHVFERASMAKRLADVVIATDDERIQKAVEAFGGKAILTRSDHQSGTDRCYEALLNCGIGDVDGVINIQGDEPFIEPDQIDQLAELLTDDSVQLATLVQRITEQNDMNDPAKVKVVLDSRNNAMYFSRAAIPHIRDVGALAKPPFYRHVGLYGYRSLALERITAMLPSPLEQLEALEQLRWLENGMRIKVAVTHYASMGVDTPADLEIARRRAQG